jgi:hypothetical protein
MDMLGIEEAAASQARHADCEAARAAYWARHQAGRRVIDALSGGQPRVRVRVALETSAGSVVTREIAIPPMPSLTERIDLALAAWRTREKRCDVSPGDQAVPPTRTILSLSTLEHGDVN